jgi:hypothetical protein
MISQIEQGERMRQHPRSLQAQAVDVVCWSYKRNSYRAFFLESLNPRVKRCHYNTDIEKATEFARSGRKPTAPDAGDEQSDHPCDEFSSDDDPIIDK